MKFSFQSTNQRNKPLEKGKIVHKVLESNLVVFINVPLPLLFFYADIGAKQDESTIQCPLLPIWLKLSTLIYSAP